VSFCHQIWPNLTQIYFFLPKIGENETCPTPPIFFENTQNSLNMFRTPIHFLTQIGFLIYQLEKNISTKNLRGGHFDPPPSMLEGLNHTISAFNVRNRKYIYILICQCSMFVRKRSMSILGVYVRMWRWFYTSILNSSWPILPAIVNIGMSESFTALLAHRVCTDTHYSQ